MTKTDWKELLDCLVKGKKVIVVTKGEVIYLVKSAKFRGNIFLGFEDEAETLITPEEVEEIYF